MIFLNFHILIFFSRHSLVYIGLNQNGKSAHNNQPKKFTFYWGEGYNYLKVCNCYHQKEGEATPISLIYM